MPQYKSVNGTWFPCDAEGKVIEGAELPPEVKEANETAKKLAEISSGEAVAAGAPNVNAATPEARKGKKKLFK